MSWVNVVESVRLILQQNKFPHLSYLGYQQIMPSPALRNYVQCFWFVDRDSVLPYCPEEFLHPDGGASIIFNLGDHFLVGETQIGQNYLFEVASTVTRRLRFQRQVAAIGVRFKPGGIFPFLSTPLYELVSDDFLLEDIGFSQVQSVYQQIGDAQSHRDKIARIEQWLMMLLSNSGNVSPLVGASLAMIKRSRGQLAMKDVADQLYISQRQLERVFKTQVGMTPKTYARMLRVAHARHMLKRHYERISITDIGLISGFSDQPHFIREFKSVVGLTPKKYLERKVAQGEPTHAIS